MSLHHLAVWHNNNISLLRTILAVFKFANWSIPQHSLSLNIVAHCFLWTQIFLKVLWFSRLGYQHGAKIIFTNEKIRQKSRIDRLQLQRDARPFTLCLHCNEPLQQIDKATVVDLLPEKVAKYYERFCTCASCKRIYWEGSHWKRMHGWLDELMARK